MRLKFTEDRFGLLHATTHLPHEGRDIQFMILEMAGQWCVYIDGERRPEMHRSQRDAKSAASKIATSFARQPMLQSKVYKTAVGLGISVCALVLFVFGLMVILALDETTNDTALVVDEPVLATVPHTAIAARPLEAVEPRHFMPEVWDQVALPLPLVKKQVSRQRYRKRPKRRRIVRKRRRQKPSYTWGNDFQIPARD